MQTLSCYERIVTLELLKGQKYEQNSLYYNIIHSLRCKLAPTERELFEYELELSKEGNYLWNEKGITEPVEIDITETEMSLITKPLIEMEQNGAIDKQFLPIFNKFIIGPDLEDRIEEPELSQQE
jgi:hypothetical protein